MVDVVRRMIYIQRSDSDVPRSIILNVVFLDLLDMVVGLWIVHAFGTESIG